MTDIDTRDKIMEAARILFADHGFEGTSVREIARAAEVNVASLNYYFSSKEKLFLEILQTGYTECALQLKSMYENNQGNLEQTLIDLFRYFLENSPDLVSQFKMMMSSQHSHHLVSQGSSEDSLYGPPGGMLIAEALKKEVPHVSDEDLIWGMRTIFSHITHIALIHNCCMKMNNNIAYSSQKDLERGIQKLIRMVLRELKEVG